MTKIPEELRYLKTHEWFRTDGDIVTVGISDFAQSQLTDVVFIDFPQTGAKKKAGEPLLSIESVKSAEDIFSPVDGDVVEVNKELSDSPEKVNKDPYGSWLVKLKKTGKTADSMSAEEYRKFIGE
ncbi:MAG: glycine cleavage system protein GcvH [Candidatus Thermoplasmatota archaeon]|jgi:glycine cleavage system H protein|nr:glycine cleavage system protein GcvH [Candidatus Thermoplasmatota archaeon]MCL5989453.1 glycine cleavage system protein GcvH [Candidatus Thermoplasmatota archaeon]